MSRGETPKRPPTEAGEEVLATGRFRVDRKRALEKMEKFQLADPLAYTVELVAAAVAAGATRIEVENDSDDFVLRWEGPGPTRDELDGLFDHLFGGSVGGRAAMLQHLALGVLGALGQAPKWVHVDRGAEGDEPALRLAVKDPSETKAVAYADAPPGTRIHVRQRLSMANVAEALLSPFQAAAETRLVRERARWCPVPLRVAGVDVRPPVPEGAIAQWAGPAGALWLVADRAARVALVRNGVVVGVEERVIGGLAVAGWFRADTVSLDASRANVVRDAAWSAVELRLLDAIAALLAAAVGPIGAALAAGAPDAEVWRAYARDLALWLVGRRRPIGGFEALPMLVDLHGRAWSPDTLRRHDAPKGIVSDASLAEPGMPHVLFGLEGRAALDQLHPGLPDLTEALRGRAAGRERRRRAEAARLPPEFPGSTTARRFADGPLRGAVRFEIGDGTTIALSLRIGGAVVEEARLPSPAGNMAAIADHPGLVADELFLSVRADETRAAVEARVVQEARALATEHIERLARGAQIAPPAMTILTAAVRAAGAKARSDLAALLAQRADDGLLRAPAFSCGDGRRLTLPEVLAGEWIVLTTLPRDCPPALAAQVLLIPDEHAPTWLGWLGARARDARTTFHFELQTAARRALPRREARLDVSGIRVPVGGGRAGELALGEGPTQIRVLRDGTDVCVLALPLTLPGVVGIVDDPSFPVTPGHDGLAAGGAEALARALAPAVDALARAAWDAAGAERPPPDAVLDWVAACKERLPSWAAERPVVVMRDGTSYTPTQLRTLGGDRRAARLKLLTQPPGDLPGFDDAAVVSRSRRRALEALAGRAVRDADADLANAKLALAQYLERPVPREPAALAERVVEEAGIRCRWILPADPEKTGVLRVEARWRGRALSTWDRGESLGLLGILEGDPIAPNAALTMLRDPNLLTPWYRRARTDFAELLEEAVARVEAGGVPPGDRVAWRALLARLERASERTRAENTLRSRLAALPLFKRLDGTCVSRAAIAAAREAGAAALVPPETPEGPADHDGYFRDEPWTSPALGVLASQLGAGGPALTAWREGMARRRALAPREARITTPTLARAALAGGALQGEVGLVAPTEGHADGLLVTPLVEGRPLDVLRVAFPAPAVAVVSGSAVGADRSFRTWQADPAQIAELVSAAHACAGTLASAVEAGRRAPQGPASAGAAEAWLVQYALGDVQGPPGELLVFPVLGGGAVSARTLADRAKLGGVGVVAGPGPAFVAGPPPVVAPPWMRERLIARFTLVDLAPVVERHRVRRPAALPLHAIAVPEGRVAWSPDVDAVEIVRDGVVLATVPAGGIVPIVGHVTAEGVDVDPCWTRLLPGPAREALDGRLGALARLALEQLLANPPAPTGPSTVGRAALHRALRGVLERARDEDALRARAAADPLVAALLAVPLFLDAAGAAGSLGDVLARSPVRWVAPGVSGRAAANRGRVWTLSPGERASLERLRPLQDATEALARETRGAARRAAGTRPPPATPRGADSVALAAPLEGALHLSEQLDASVELRVDGAVVRALPAPVPGLAGWVQGPFEVDDAFADAVVRTSELTELRAAAATLLRREAGVAPDRTRARLSAALAAKGHDVDGLLAEPLSPWSEVPLYVDGAGAPVDLPGLVRMRKGGKRLLVGGAGAEGTRKGERVVVGGPEVLAQLRAWFPDTPVEHVAEAEARRDERKREEQARKSSNAREKRERLFHERAARLAMRWCGSRPPEAAIAAVIEAWSAGRRPGWQSILEVDPEGPWAALVAFAADSPKDAPGSHILRLARAAGLARALAGKP